MNGNGVVKAVILPMALALLTGCGGRFADLTREDVQRAFEIAQAAQDVAGMQCALEILAALPDADHTRLAPNGVFSTFMAAREARRRVSGGVPDAVHHACAVLVLDAQQTLLKLGLTAVPGGGVLGGLIR